MADYIYYVTVSGGAFLIDGEPQAELGLKAGLTYRFDVSDASCASQTFKFSATSDGTHGGGSEYTTNVTVTGTAGSSGAVVDLVVPSSTGTLYYYNGAASGYGGTILHTTGTYVSTANLGLRIPLPGASDDVWASHLNASLRTLDSGVVKAVAGAAATPSITNTSDTNTGIYFPAADTVGVSTGGTERLRIDSSGNVELTGNLTAGTLGSGVVFPAGHIIKIQEFTNTDTTDTWNSTSWRSVVSGAYALSNASNKLLFHVQASIGKSTTATGLYGQITSKDGTSTSLTHDGTAFPEGINPISGNSNIQRVPFGVVAGNAYSSGDLVDYITGYIVHSPGTVNSKQYQFQCRGRSDVAYTFATNRASTVSNGGYEIYGICRMIIMEFVA